MSKIAWEWPNSEIVRIIDGDTLIAKVFRDLGFHGTASFQVRLRLNRINAAPLHSEGGSRSKTMLESLLTADVLVTITTVAPYKYGDEWMAEIVLPDGRNVSDEMVAQGGAVAWDGTGKRPGG